MEEPEKKQEQPEEGEMDAKQDAEDDEQEQCDPATMDCDQLTGHFQDLITKDHEIKERIKKIEELRDEMPSDEIDKIYSKAVAEQEKIDNEVDNVVERAIGCRTPPSNEMEDETTED